MTICLKICGAEALVYTVGKVFNGPIQKKILIYEIVQSVIGLWYNTRYISNLVHK